MVQTRTKRLVVLLEPVVYTAMQALVEKINKEDDVNSTSESSYGRKLVINDLLASGLLTEKMLIDANT